MATPPARAPERGDRFLLEYDYSSLTPREIGRLFGDSFGEALTAQRTGTWEGPLESGYGTHLVRIHERIEGALPSLDDVRDQVLRDFDNDRRLQMNASFFAALRDRYTIEIESETVRSAEGGSDENRTERIEP